ncbi:MAG TPA: 50S ribosomal protein L15 [Nitrospiraceae bacterium]|jgi:large subunit ribosomal protein L15|nr:50S ribosomal protein L15 [Nitrospiraceae bacterium]
MKLHDLTPPRGAKRRPKRIGRGPGSGHGKTSTKGHKGLLARSGGGKRPGFEGGQMPLIRRLPKYGFINPFRTEYVIVNLKSLAEVETTEAITPEFLVREGFIRRKGQLVKILGLGEITRPLVIQAHKFSKSAETKIQAAGGRAEVIRGV